MRLSLSNPESHQPPFEKGRLEILTLKLTEFVVLIFKLYLL